MCTVTYFPLQNPENFILTVNRDESQNRPAIAPKIYKDDGLKILYPKDPEKGGTWIGVSDQKRVINLMNGAFKKHERKPNYRKSRGLVVLDLLKAENFIESCENYNFQNIEPFTVICVDWKKSLKIYEFRWDGKNRFLNEKNREFQVWSASMTYNESQRKTRTDFFNQKIDQGQNRNSIADKLWELHHTTKENSGPLDLIIDRGLLKTTSISQVIKNADELSFKFEDLLSGEEKTKKFHLNE